MFQNCGNWAVLGRCAGTPQHKDNIGSHMKFGDAARKMWLKSSFFMIFGGQKPLYVFFWECQRWTISLCNYRINRGQSSDALWLSHRGVCGYSLHTSELRWMVYYAINNIRILVVLILITILSFILSVIAQFYILKRCEHNDVLRHGVKTWRLLCLCYDVSFSQILRIISSE